ncbi:MAG: Eco57I restriction-modification methylase domain-containing protein [Myxococcota bacterium]
MNSLSQNWRQLISTRPSNWSDFEVISATVHQIVAQFGFDYQTVVNSHPWLTKGLKFNTQLEAPIAALGWVYQYLNDQRRYDIDRMLVQDGKIEIEQIACRTQIFTPLLRARHMAQMTIGLFCVRHGLAESQDLPISVPHAPSPLTCHPSEITILDPACGTGILLLEGAKCLHEIWKKWALRQGEAFNSAQVMAHIIENQLTGCDVSKAPLQIARLSLELLSMEYGGEVTQLNLHDLSKQTLGALNPNCNVSCLTPNSQHIVLLNPPYQNTRKINGSPLKNWYPDASTDLFAAFMLKAIEWLRPNGNAGLLTMHNWLFLRQHHALRMWLTQNAHLQLIEQHSHSDFDGLNGEVTQSALSIWTKQHNLAVQSVGINPKGEHFRFHTSDFKQLPHNKILFWWTRSDIENYATSTKLSDVAPAHQGLATGNNDRFLRFVWEVPLEDLGRYPDEDCRWLPYTKGAAGRAWFTPLETVIYWPHQGWHKKSYSNHFGSRGGNGCPNIHQYGKRGIAYAKIGHRFSAREILRPGVIGNAGSAIFPPENQIPMLLCLLNHPKTQTTLEALNPTVNFTESDINALPIFPIAIANDIYATLRMEYQRIAKGRENSMDFCHPQAHRWPEAQKWASLCLEHNTLLDFNASYVEPSETDWLSYAIGILLGRFKRPTHDWKPYFTLVVHHNGTDDLEQKSSQRILSELEIKTSTLREFLLDGYFDHQLKIYQQHPIMWPLRMGKTKSIIWINALKANASDIEKAIKRSERSTSSIVESHGHSQLKSLLFQGPTHIGGLNIEQSSAYRRHLDDGLLCQSARLWPAIAIKWPKAQKRWNAMASKNGKANYAWSQCFRDFWPSRYMEMLKLDPSLRHKPPPASH